MVRGHRIRRALASGVLPRQQEDLPQFLVPLESLFVPSEDCSVENLAASGLAGILNMLQMTLARWSGLSRMLSAEQKAHVLQTLSSGSGPIVSIVRNVSATSLQMAVRCYFSRKKVQHVRHLQRMRVGANASNDMPEVVAPQEFDDGEIRSRVAAGDMPEAVHPEMLVRQSATASSRRTSRDIYRPDRSDANGAGGGFVPLTQDERLSASVATFVRQMSHMLQQGPLRHRHRQSFVSLLHDAGGPLAKNLRHLSAMSLQAVVRGHHVRRRVPIRSFMKAVGQISKLESVSKLSLAQAIGTGRHLFSFQGRYDGGTHTFYSAVCAGNGFVSDVLRHSSCVAIQCAFRSRRARREWAGHARDALLQPVGESRDQVVRAGRSRKEARRERRAAAAKEAERKREIKYDWTPIASGESPQAPSELRSHDPVTVQDRSKEQLGLESQQSGEPQGVTGASASSVADKPVEREAHSLDTDSNSTEYESSDSHRSSGSTGSYQSESQDEEWDFQVEDDEYEIFQQALRSSASPRPEDLAQPEAAARTGANVGVSESTVTDREDAHEHSKDVQMQRPLGAFDAEEERGDFQKRQPEAAAHASSLRPSTELLQPSAMTAEEEEAPGPQPAQTVDAAPASFAVVTATETATPADGPVRSAVSRSGLQSGQVDKDFNVSDAKSLGRVLATSASGMNAKAAAVKPSKLSDLAAEAHTWMEAIPVREGGLEGVQMSSLSSSAQYRQPGPTCFSSRPSKEQIPVLMQCMRGEAGWRQHMMRLVRSQNIILRHDSALYQVLYDGYEYLEMEARGEAAECLGQLSSVALECRLFVIDQGTIGDLCNMLKRGVGPRVALASLLERLAYHSPQRVISWVQTHSGFARIELFLLQLLDIIHAAHMEASISVSVHGGAASQQHEGQVLQDVDQLVNTLLRVVLNVVACLKAYGWQQLIARGGTESIASLLSSPTMPACTHELICCILSSLLMFSKGRGRFKACNGLSLLVTKMRDFEVQSAAAAAHVLRVYLVATEELALDAAALLALECDRALVSLITRIHRAGDVCPGGRGGGTRTLAGLLPLMTLLIQAERTKESVLMRNTDVVALTLDMLRACSESGCLDRQQWAFNLACMRLVSRILSSAYGLNALQAGGAVLVFEHCVATAPTHQHRSLAVSILARLDTRRAHATINAEQTLGLEASLRALLGGLVTQEPADKLECLHGLVRMAATLDGRRLMLNLQLQAGTQMGAGVVVEAIVATFASACLSTRESRDGGPYLPQVAAQMRTECAKIVYLLADPQETAATVGGMVTVMYQCGVLGVLFAAIKEERGGRSIKLGTEARGPALVASMAALFRLLTHATVRAAMLAQDSARSLPDLCDLIPLIRSPNTQVSLYATLIIGKLFSDGLSRHACRWLVADSGIMSSLILALQDSCMSPGASAAASSAVGQQQGLARRSALLHTLSALSHLKLARQVLAAQECLPLIFRAMAEADVVECRLTLDERDPDTLLPASDFAVESSAEMLASKDKVHVGPFSPDWYGRDTAVAPQLCTRSDCLYILFNMAMLDFSRGHWPRGRSPSAARMVDKCIEALLRVTNADTDCCNLQTLMMMHALRQLLAPLHTHKSSSSSAAHRMRTALIRDAIDTITTVGTHILHAVSSDRKTVSLIGGSRRHEALDSEPHAHFRAGDSRGRGRVAEQGMRSRQGLFTLHAAVSALLQVCTDNGQAAVPALRNDPNFLHFLFAVLSVLHDAGLQADAARQYQDALVFPDSALFALHQPLFSDLLLQHKVACQMSSTTRLRNVSNQIYERLFARVRCECAEALMHISWSCLPEPLLVRQASMSDNRSPNMDEWGLDDGLAQALAHGTISATLLPRKVLVNSVQAAGAPHLLLGLLADHKTVSADTMCTRISALHVLGAILLREAWSGRDAYFRSCGTQLLAALSRLLLLPHAHDPGGTRHGAAFCSSLAAILAILCVYPVRPSKLGQPMTSIGCSTGSMHDWLMQRGVQHSPLAMLVSSCVSFLGVADTSSVAASMVLRFLRMLAVSETGCQAVLQAVGNAGMCLSLSCCPCPGRPRDSLPGRLPQDELAAHGLSAVSLRATVFEEKARVPLPVSSVTTEWRCWQVWTCCRRVSRGSRSPTSMRHGRRRNRGTC